MNVRNEDMYKNNMVPLVVCMVMKGEITADVC